MVETLASVVDAIGSTPLVRLDPSGGVACRLPTGADGHRDVFGDCQVANTQVTIGLGAG
jgi:hypothetical protein